MTIDHRLIHALQVDISRRHDLVFFYFDDDSERKCYQIHIFTTQYLKNGKMMEALSRKYLEIL